jgi:dihydrofolate synthase/folylpolyglutamate synthase
MDPIRAPAPPRFRTYRDAEAYLLGFVNYELRSGYRPTTRTHDLVAFSRRLRERGWDPGRVPTVHVGGTNGKGTITWLLERVLRAGGVRTGLYSSPHLHDMRERIRIQGRALGAERFRAMVEDVARDFGTAPESGFRTTFEHLTALAFLAFQQARVERAVVEVGLGGRLDATNVLPAGPVLFTPISLDHREILGRTVAAIARDKAAILKRGGVAYVLPQSAPAYRELARRARSTGTSLIDVRRRVQVVPANPRPDGRDWRLCGRSDYGVVPTGLLGVHQSGNLAGVVAVAEDLLDEETIRGAVRRGLRGVVVPGRLEPIRRGRWTYLLDAGHNPAAARTVCRALRDHHPGREVTAVVGMARDKDHRGFLRALAPGVARFVLTAGRNPRAAAPGALVRAAPGRAETAPGVEAALHAARRGEPDLILVTGSFVVVGEARSLLGRRRT